MAEYRVGFSRKGPYHDPDTWYTVQAERPSQAVIFAERQLYADGLGSPHWTIEVRDEWGTRVR